MQHPALYRPAATSELATKPLGPINALPTGAAAFFYPRPLPVKDGFAQPAAAAVGNHGLESRQLGNGSLAKRRPPLTGKTLGKPEPPSTVGSLLLPLELQNTRPPRPPDLSPYWSREVGDERG